MRALTSSERKTLRGFAHAQKPIVQVGKGGITDGLIAQVDRALVDHELIKIRFIAGKTQKEELLAEIEERTGAQKVGLVGHVGILFRQNEDPEKRWIEFPDLHGG